MKIKFGLHLFLCALKYKVNNTWQRAKMSHLWCLCLHLRLFITTYLVWHFLVTFPETTDKSWGILPDDKQNWVFSFGSENVCAHLDGGQCNPSSRKKQIMMCVALAHLLNLRLCRVGPRDKPTHWAKSPAKESDVRHLLAKDAPLFFLSLLFFNSSCSDSIFRIQLRNSYSLDHGVILCPASFTTRKKKNKEETNQTMHSLIYSNL